MKKSKPLEQHQIEDAARLKAIFSAKRPKISQADFGMDFDIGSQGMVWQYLNARRPLNIAAAAAFAKGLDRKIEDFSPTLAAQINEASLSTESPKPGVAARVAPRTAPNPGMQLIGDDEYYLLDLYRRADARGREDIVTEAEKAIKSPLISSLGNQS